MIARGVDGDFMTDRQDIVDQHNVLVAKSDPECIAALTISSKGVCSCTMLRRLVHMYIGSGTEQLGGVQPTRPSQRVLAPPSQR